MSGLGYRSSRRLLHAVLAVALVVCALGVTPRPALALDLFGIHLWGKKPVPTGADAVPDPQIYTPELTVAGDEGLTKTLRTSSQLIGELDTPPSGTVGLVTRARNDQQRLVATLYAEGYYGGTVTISIAGRRYDQLPIETVFPPGQAVPVTIAIDTGPQFVFGDVQISMPEAKVPLGAKLKIAPGRVAKSGLIVGAEQQLVDSWRRQGYPLARIAERQVQANHATRKLNVRIVVATGPQARFGQATVSGAETVDPGLVVSQAAIPEGRLYDPRVLSAAETRLQGLGVFNSVSVRPDTRVGPDGLIPVTIDVRERKPRTVGTGLTASNTDGLGLEAYWVHRNLFGGAEQLRVEGAIGRIGDSGDIGDLDYRGAVIFDKPEAFGPATKLTTRIEGTQEHPDAYERQALTGTAYATRTFSPFLTGRLGVEGEVSRVEDFATTQDNLLAGVPVGLEFDTRDNALNPTRGVHATLFAEPVEEFNDDTGFLSSKGSIATYRAVGAENRVVLAGRVAGGAIVGADVLDIPANRRFYAGGGGSIRGYAYQAASPRDANGNLIGGLSFAEASLEARIAITQTIGIVPFIDAGGAFSSNFPGANEDFYAGAGLGLRYLTPVGPLRLDVAVPLNTIADEPDFAVYLGVGQAF